jgi:xanthine dehydrogenase YagS FAD-binding subunit
MHPFTFMRAADEPSAIRAGAADNTQLIAGGTTLVDLMRLEVMRPDALVDIRGLPYHQIEASADGVRIGALVPNSEVAHHPEIMDRYPALSEALLSGASPQLRNMATTGGNLLQRTRCPYFRDPQIAACNKRIPGSGCAAIGGFTRPHAILGVSDKCIAAHPSDQNVALVALDAIVHVTGANGSRAIAITDLHTLPGQTPEREHVLDRGDLITHITLPASPFAARSRYLKVRDRASYAFALASAAVALEIAGGTIKSARIALGGVATKPWRSQEAEQILVGQKPNTTLYRKAADAALAAAAPQSGNQFKVELAKRAIVRVLGELAGGGS